MTTKVHHGDCLDVMAGMDENSVDAVVTDPPYGLEFMGKEWDRVQSHRTWAEAALRVLKPGGHLVAFGGTRTHHRLWCALEDAGFEIRDTLMWLYGSGFPKSLDVSKAIDKAAGAEREVVGSKLGRPGVSRDGSNQGRESWRRLEDRADRQPPTLDLSAPATDAARRWQGFGTSLKPAWEPIVLARKPLAGTVAANVQAHGTGALNVDGCRVGTDESWAYPTGPGGCKSSEFHYQGRAETPAYSHPAGRWPANVVLDEEAAAMLDAQSGASVSTGGQASLGAFRGGRVYGAGRDEREARDPGYGDSGGASRFFYVAKASRAERGNGNNHPTVKPLALMRWLVRLVTPPGGLILDPFVGSGTTALAAVAEGFSCVGIDSDEGYCELALKRLAQAQPALVCS